MDTITITKEEYDNLINQVKMIPQVAQQTIKLMEVIEKQDEKIKKERAEAKVLEDWKSKMEENGYGVCAECDKIANGETEERHQHSKHGYLSVCDECSDNAGEEEVEYDCGCSYAERQNSYIMGNDDLEEEHYICEKCFEDFCSKDHPKYNGKNGWCYLMDKDN